MEKLEFDTLVGTPEELIKKIRATRDTTIIATYQNQYNPKKHDITDTTKRQDKVVTTDDGTSVVTVARIPIPLQKKIVGLAASFLCGNPITLSTSPADDLQTGMLQVLTRTWDDNKLNYDSKTLAKIMMSETQVAELWYTEPIEEGYWIGTVNDSKAKFRLRMKILANKFGDSLYPVYNAAGDMIAFGRGYKVKLGEKEEEHFDVYTDLKNYLFVKGDSGYTVTQEANMVQKIPVIYYEQENPEWHDVQEMIERLEKLISNHADSNDYFGSPMVFVQGEIEGFAKKGEQGKVLIGKNGAKAEYLTWDQAPESVKLEYSNLRSLIFDLTDTPDISIENMKSLGVFSGIALKMLFLGAHLKASDKEETFGKGIQRRVNYLKSALAKINVALEKAQVMTITPVFEYYLPKNNQEMIEMLSTATVGKPIMSVETAVKNNPFVKDPKQELTTMQEEGLEGDTIP